MKLLSGNFYFHIRQQVFISIDIYLVLLLLYIANWERNIKWNLHYDHNLH